MLDFIISIAKDVLSGVITDLIKGQIKIAFKSDIEKEVADELIKRARENHVDDLWQIRRKILEEIEILSSREPDLVVSGEKIQLNRPAKKPLLPIGNDKIVERELVSRLEKLDQVVTQRREELGLPTKLELEKSSEAALSRGMVNVRSFDMRLPKVLCLAGKGIVDSAFEIA